MKLHNVVVVLAAVAVVGMLAGCQHNGMAMGGGGKAPAAANVVCPMSGQVIGKNPPTTMCGGKTVAFCCPDCIAPFNKLSDADKKAKLDAAMAKQATLVCNGKCPMSGKPVSKAATMRAFDGKVVGFCCGGCPAKWDKMTDDQKKAKLDAAMK